MKTDYHHCCVYHVLIKSKKQWLQWMKRSALNPLCTSLWYETVQSILNAAEIQCRMPKKVASRSIYLMLNKKPPNTMILGMPRYTAY